MGYRRDQPWDRSYSYVILTTSWLMSVILGLHFLLMTVIVSSGENKSDVVSRMSDSQKQVEMRSSANNLKLNATKTMNLGVNWSWPRK